LGQDTAPVLDPELADVPVLPDPELPVSELSAIPDPLELGSVLPLEVTGGAPLEVTSSAFGALVLVASVSASAAVELHPTITLSALPTTTFQHMLQRRSV
jgi:hypothetical protein